MSIDEASDKSKFMPNRSEPKTFKLGSFWNLKPCVDQRKDEEET